jgi:CheY-like chemotaxis protein/two-component sensor histidine kinase
VDFLADVISRQIGHLTHLVDDLLDVSRVSRGLVTLDKAAVDMRQIVLDAVEQARPLIDAKRHRLTLRTAAAGPFVLGDAKRLVQIVANLLGNAAKYTRDGGEIDVALDVDGNRVTVDIADNGIGMQPELASRVFDLFAQGERTSDRSTGGLGIGLAIVKNLVELHGGSVACASGGSGRGSRFTVELPLLADEAGGDDAMEAPDREAPPQAMTILVVDDNQDAAAMLAMLLEASGHRVLVEHDSTRALEVARARRPDVCLIDIGLPGMDGNALARALRDRADTAGALLIAVTGYGQQSDRAQSRAAGFDHHLVKPVDIDALEAIVNARLPSSAPRPSRPPAAP